jgi:hypothetical protein
MLALATAAAGGGVWLYLRLRDRKTPRATVGQEVEISWPKSPQVQKQETNPEISLFVSAMMGCESEKFSIDDPIHEPSEQRTSIDSPVLINDPLKGTEIVSQDNPPFLIQFEDQFSGANRRSEPIIHKETTAGSDSDVPLLAKASPTSELGPINEFSYNDKTEVQHGEAATSETDLGEPDTDLGPREVQSHRVVLLGVEEISASETQTATNGQEERANGDETLNPLSDSARKEITIVANEKVRRVPAYRPLAPTAATVPTRARRSAPAASKTGVSSDLKLRLQLLFARGGDAKLCLVADRREHMPDEVEVSFAEDKLLLVGHHKDCYEPVSLLEAGGVLDEGVEWHGSSDSAQFRWTLSRRQLHVLAEGDVSGLYPFGSTARLQLNARHVVIADASLRQEVLTALSEVGCATQETYDDKTPGVPAGWLLIRNVIPTRSVPMRNASDILNSLCPLPQVQAYFVGGIHLERATWLFGYPPQIRLTGDLSGVEIKLDGQPAIVGSDGSVIATNWDAVGDHQLWFGGQTQIYTLRTMDEDWHRWPAIDFRMGATICGASIASSRWSQSSNQVRVTATNTLLIGAQPGEVFDCYRSGEVRSQEFLVCTSFQPVWALPSDPAHANRDTARIVLLGFAEPSFPDGMKGVNSRSRPMIQRWASLLNEASKKRLRIKPDNPDAAALWLRYRALAKQLRRKLR